MSHLQPKERLQAHQGGAHLQQAAKGGTRWGPQAHLFALCLHQAVNILKEPRKRFSGLY